MSKASISISQIRHSIKQLEPMHPFFGMAFLAFKNFELPIGQRVRIGFAKLMRNFLSEYFKPSASYPGYYNPFRTSDPSNRWLTHKYPSGALQRITVDTFGAALIHDKNDPRWGWRENYVDVLMRRQRETNSARIPVFHLAVWIFRNQEFNEGVSPEELISRFLAKFHITEDEYPLLSLGFSSKFDLSADWLVDNPPTEQDLLREIGWPPGQVDDRSVRLNLLAFTNVGPTSHLEYEPSERINLITGDNSVGKSFLLDTVWWAITGYWTTYPAFPRARTNPTSSTIEYELEAPKPIKHRKYQFEPSTQSWAGGTSENRPSGLAIYARYDGSFVSWDTSLTPPNLNDDETAHQVLLTREELFYGKQIRNSRGNISHLCNGLLYDWIQWQTRASRFEQIFNVFEGVLRTLSPSRTEQLVPDEPMMDEEAGREIPTLRMPYGPTKITLASAGVQRVIGLAYFIVWAWFQHLSNSNRASREPQSKMVLLIDEVEAHLHPKWQRVIVPAIHKAINVLSNSLSFDLEIQAHIATHSPLVLASAEPIFDRNKDALHHLYLKDESVSVDFVPFHKRGSVDAWLTSDIFGLLHARSLDAELAIEAAKELQLRDNPDPKRIEEVNGRLVKTLRDDDEFWPRWRYFAQNKSQTK